MEIPTLSGDEDEDEINPMKWLRMEKVTNMFPFGAGFCFHGESFKWWKGLDKDTRIYTMWDEFEKAFSRRWIKDSKMEAMNKILDELNEAREKNSKL